MNYLKAEKEISFINGKIRQLDYNKEFNIIKRSRTFNGIYHLKHQDIILDWIDFNKPINCLEIGTHEGQSTTYFLNKYLKNNKKSKLLCCDPFYKSHWCNLNEMALCYEDILKINLKNNDIFNQVKIYRGKGEDLYKEEFYQKEVYDFIYIDDIHSYKATSLNIKNCWDKLKIGGIIIFDDYNEDYAHYDREEARGWCEPVRKALDDHLFDGLKHCYVLWEEYQIIIVKLLQEI